MYFLFWRWFICKWCFSQITPLSSKISLNFCLVSFLGLAPGTVVITDKAVDYSFRPQFEQVVLGKVITRSSELDEGVASELLQCSSELQNVPTVLGNTMCTHDFYEGITRILRSGCLLSHLQIICNSTRRELQVKLTGQVVTNPVLCLSRSRPTWRSSLLLFSWRKTGVSEESLRGRSEEYWNGVHRICCYVPCLWPQRYCFWYNMLNIQ